MRLLRLAILPPLLAVAACGSADEADPSGITAGEAQELNDAATMLDANAIELNAVTGPGTPQ